MSIQAMVWAIEQQLVTDPSARHVLLGLANYAGELGAAAFPSIKTMSTQTGLSERTIQRKLDDLLSSGIIRLGDQSIAAAYIGRADRRPVVYDLLIHRGVTVSPRKATGCHPRQNGVTLTTERGDTVSPNPLKALPFKDPRAVDKSTRADQRREAEIRGLAEAAGLLRQVAG